MRHLLRISCVWLPLMVTVHATMIIRNYTPLRHDRFYAGNDKAFVGDPYDFSGVGQSSDGRWATLISDSYFISANHFHPAISSSVTFRETNSLAGPSHTYTVTGGQQIGTTDLWVGWFAAPVSATLERYPVLDLPNASDYVGLLQYNYGNNNIVGRNITVDVSYLNFPPSDGFIFIADYDNNDIPTVGGDETFLQGGDSGAPTFNVAIGQLALTGIHWAITDDVPGTNEGESFVDSAVPAYIDPINTVLGASGQSLVLIPEPSSALLFCCGWVVWVALAGRRAALGRQ